ncbi:MAG: hypothetical protein R3F48_07955 [Candidatus Zixiibacteriota bacterium]
MSMISDNARNTGTCPFCKELINKTAVRCPHCHADLKPPASAKRKNSFANGFYLGLFVATVLWVAVIVLFYMYVE